MALRAGYYGLKRSLKDKLFNLAASTPADIGPDNPIAGYNDVAASINLLDDTVGWTGKQKITFPYYQIAPTFTRDGVTYTTDDKGVITATSNGQAATGSAEAQLHGRLNTPTYVPMYLPIGKYVISPLCEDSDIRIQAATTYNSAFSGLSEYVYGTDVGYFEITANTNSDYKLEDGSVLCAIYIASKNSTKVWNNIKIFPIICLEKLFKLSPTYEPYHASVAETLESLIGDELSTTGLTYTNCEYVAGGYVISGNICTVNIRVKATADAGISINGLPNAKISNNSNYIPATMHKVGGAITDSIPAYCTSDGLLSGFQDAVTDSNYLISASYLIRSSVSANREISADPEIKEPATKKATKKKVIKEEE